MILNYDQLVTSNIKFYDSFIDLKVVGWKSYSKALNEYTQGFFNAQLKQSDKTVEQIADTMKSIFPTIKGICK